MPTALLTAPRLLAITVAALLAMSLAPDRYCGYSSIPRDILMATLKWTSGPLKNISARVRERVDQPVNSPSLKASEQYNRDLAAENLQLRAQIYRLQLENRSLQDLRSKDPDRSNTFYIAPIIADSATASFTTLTLEGGALQGIEVGLPAVISGSVVGRISQVNRHSSVLEPITTRDRLVTGIMTPPVMSAANFDQPSYPVVQFHIRDHDHFLAEVPINMPVKVNDVARLQDENWPQAVQYLMLGHVISVEPIKDDLLRKQVLIRTFTAIRHARSVTIIIPSKTPAAPRGKAGDK